MMDPATQLSPLAREQLRLLASSGWFSHAQLQGAVEALLSEGRADLLNWLVERGLLPEDRAAEVRLRMPGRDSRRSLTVPLQTTSSVATALDSGVNPLTNSSRARRLPTMTLSSAANSGAIPVLPVADETGDFAAPRFGPQDFPFEVVGTVGEGGTAVISKVIDTRLQRSAALKVLRKKDGPRAVERFIREARITARLDHPSIPPVYESGLTPEGDPYLLMRLIEGQTFRELLELAREKGELASERRTFLTVLLKVAEALAFAHERGIVHRDVKPENIMVGPFGEVLLMDWGLARDMAEEADDPDLLSGDRTSLSVDEAEAVGLADATGLVGTIGYMAPEQVEGSSISSATDAFALGAILTELLTGEDPIPKGPRIKRLLASAEGRARRPREIDPSVPVELDSLAAAALTSQPQLRLADAGAFLADLKRYLDGALLQTHNYGPGERALRWAQRNPGRMWTVTAVSVTALIVLILGLELRLSWAASTDALETIQALTRRNKALTDARDAEEARVAELNRQLVTFEDRARMQARARRERRLALDALANAAASLGSLPAESLQMQVEESVRKAPGDLPFLFDAATLLRQAGRSAAGRALLEAPTRLDPPDPYAYAWLDAYDQMEALAPASRPAWSALTGRRDLSKPLERYLEAERAAQAGSWARARDLYRGALDEEPGFLPALLGRARASAELDQPDFAIQDLSQALALCPRLAGALALRGEQRMRRGLLDLARQDLDAALALRPELLRARGWRGMHHLRLGHFQAARDDLSAALDGAPDDVDLLYSLGVARLWSGDTSGAVQELTRALNRSPKDSRLITMRGRAFADLGNWEEARKAFAESQRLEEGNVYNLIWLTIAGDPPAALEEVAKGSSWACRIAAFVVGQLTSEALLAEARAVTDEARRKRALCEAHCYIALLAETRGEVSKARESYRACVSEGVHGDIETHWSRLRLQRPPFLIAAPPPPGPKRGDESP